MERHADGTLVKAVRLAAVVMLVVVAFWFGRLSCADVSDWTPPEPDYTTYTKDELSWVQEGIQERISELEDELERVADIMGIER